MPPAALPVNFMVKCGQLFEHNWTKIDKIAKIPQKLLYELSSFKMLHNIF